MSGVRFRLARFIAAAGAANLADGVAMVAWGWAATLLTRDPLLVALVPVALRLPWVLLALPAGVMTDRVDRLRLVRAMDALRALAFVAVALAMWQAGPLPSPPATGLAAPGLFAVLVLAALVIGGAEVFRDNAAQTLLPALVDPDQLESANGRLWGVELLGNALIGPALGALLIGWALALPFAMNAGAYLLAVLLLSGMAGQFTAKGQAKGHWRAELAEGARFLWAAPLLRTLALLTGGWNLLFQMVIVALVLHAQESLQLSATAYGLALSGGAVGGLIGTLLGGRIIAALGPARTAQWMLAASAPAFAAMALAPDAVFLALALALSEATGLIWNMVAVSHRQRVIPDRLLGRVNSLYRLLAWGTMPLGLALSGLVMRQAEGPLSRPDALVLPIWLAAGGAVALALSGWRAIARGFA